MLLTILTYVLTLIEILSCVLLVGIILLQKPRGQGSGLAFGAGMGESLFGSQVGNVLTRTTVILGVVFLVNTALLAVLGSRGSAERSVVDRLPPPAAPVQPAYPAQPAGPAPAGGRAPAVPSEFSVPPSPPAPEPAAAPAEAAPFVPVAPPADAVGSAAEALPAPSPAP